MQRILASRATTLVLLFLATVLAIHLIGQVLESARADVTEDDLYSLSPGSEAILTKLGEEGVAPIDVKLYFSLTAGKTLPQFIKDFITYERYLRNLLKEYERAADGKLRVSFIDPLPDSDEAQDALDYGLDGKLINQHGDLFFFGLVFETQTGTKDTIEFLWPDQQENVEYEIAKRLYNQVWPSGKKIGVLSGLEVMGTGDNPYLAQMLAAQGKTPKQKWIALQLLEESYEISGIDREAESISPDEVDLVVVIHPKSLPKKSLWALDEWIVKGGNALVFLDPYAIDDQAPQNPQQPLAAMQYRPSSNLEPLLAAWGLRRPEDRFAADLDLAVRRQVVARGPQETMVVDLAIDQDTRGETLAQGHPILQGLASLRFLLPGVLEPSGETPDGVELTPLITTTAGGSTLTIEPGFGQDGLHYFDLQDAAKLRDRYSPGTDGVVLAYQVSGKLPSAYPQGAEFPSETPQPPPGLPPGIELPPPEGAEMISKEPVPEEERAESTVLVFADVDLIADQIAFSQSFLGLMTAANDNHKVLLNAVDYLLGSQELMAVRGKHSIERPFSLFDDIEAAAEAESLERERQLREEIEGFQQQLSDKQSGLTQANAALLEKQVRDEVERLNEQIRESNRKLLEIRKQRRAALASEEAKVRFSVIWLMPAVVLGVGIFLAFRRRVEARHARV